MIDRAEIRVRAGDGGDGSISFRREKFVPFGGPDGGDGGNGGNVIIRADASVENLRRYRQKRLYRAGRGLDGSGNRRHGGNGEDAVLSVPLGTIITVLEGDNEVRLADLERAGDEAIVAQGGRGGWGNTHFATSTNQAPHIARKGDEGEEKDLRLEMRIIADAGIIGCPNAGKSTLLASASAARPKVADYPFTTIEPVLGVVETGREPFVLAEIPGLVEDAHMGRGLGLDFLRHAMRTRVLVHLLDGATESPSRGMLLVNEELARYDPELARKPQLVAVNKIDITEVREKLPVIKKQLASAGIRAHYISAATGEGVPALMAAVSKLLEVTAAPEKREEVPVKVFRPRPRREALRLERRGDEFVLEVPELDRLTFGAGARPGEVRQQLMYQLERLGVNKALEKAGIKPGNKVRCGDLTWEWRPRRRKA